MLTNFSWCDVRQIILYGSWIAIAGEIAVVAVVLAFRKLMPNK